MYSSYATSMLFFAVNFFDSTSAVLASHTESEDDFIYYLRKTIFGWIGPPKFSRLEAEEKSKIDTFASPSCNCV